MSIDMALATNAQLGVLAALGTSVCWTCSSLALEVASRRIGSLSLNLVRLLFATLLLCALSWLERGEALPLGLSPRAWGLLAASGLVGFVLGDYCLFRALATLGVRLAMLIQSVAPALTALIGWVALGEVPSQRGVLGIALTVAGVAWATLARTRGSETRASLAGVLLALGGALGQALGLVLSTLAVRPPPGAPPEAALDAVAATQARVLAAVLGFAVVITASRWWRRFGASWRDGKAVGFAALGALFGPALGVTLSLVAVKHAQAGIAASLMALPPVLLLPVARWRGERVGIAGVGGALTAVAGVALLALE